MISRGARAVCCGARYAVQNHALLDESRLPGLYMSIWHALWALKGTPADVVAKLNGALKEAMADPAIRMRLEDLGQEIPPLEQQTPDACGPIIRRRPRSGGR